MNRGSSQGTESPLSYHSLNKTSLIQLQPRTTIQAVLQSSCGHLFFLSGVCGQQRSWAAKEWPPPPKKPTPKPPNQPPKTNFAIVSNQPCQQTFHIHQLQLSPPSLCHSSITYKINQTFIQVFGIFLAEGFKGSHRGTLFLVLFFCFKSSFFKNICLSG